jgi:hypothetical protein
VLGVGSIPSVELGSGNYRSQSTYVPLNGAYILSEDQNGVGAQFGASRNYFDYGGGTKNTIAQTSENFVTAEGNFSTAEQDSLVSQQLTGVCNSSSGCTGTRGIQTSINQYKLYPISYADFFGGTSDSTIGVFGGPQSGRRVSTASPPDYWLRSSPDGYNNYGSYVIISSGIWGSYYGTYQDGFRPAGVLNLESAQCLPLANISVRKLFKNCERGKNLT